MEWLWLLIGFLVGALSGIVVTSLLHVSKASELQEVNDCLEWEIGRLRERPNMQCGRLRFEDEETHAKG